MLIYTLFFFLGYAGCLIGVLGIRKPELIQVLILQICPNTFPAEDTRCIILLQLHSFYLKFKLSLPFINEVPLMKRVDSLQDTDGVMTHVWET